jgi:hypothetical protein
MRNEDMRKRLNKRDISGCWQLVAPVWQLVALKYWFSGGYLAVAFARKTKNTPKLRSLRK